MSALRARAPGKVNLCLFLGPVRPDGLHELVSVVQPLDLADELILEPAEAREGRRPGREDEPPADEVVCPGVEGENLAARALRAYREAVGLEGAWRLTIDKRVPVAAGMGGGSSDAAAALRLVARAAGHADDRGALAALAARLGADVPALLHAGPALVTGAGEEVRPLGRPGAGVEARPLGAPGPWSYLVVALPHRLATADVFAEADRLGLPRSAPELAARRREVEAALAEGPLPPHLMRNDLADAARSLCPAIDPALDAMRAAGAVAALVTGSGPTVFGAFDDRDAAREALAAVPGALATTAASSDFAEVHPA